MLGEVQTGFYGDLEQMLGTFYFGEVR